MDNDTRLAYEPTTTAHPGKTVVEYLEFNEWSQRDLARRTGLTPKTISEICNGKAPITPTTSLALEKVFQRPAHFWLNLQRRFDEAEARQYAAEKQNTWQGWASKFPLKEMAKLGWLETAGSGGATVDSLLSFLGVSSPDSWDAVWKSCEVAYRQTRKFQISEEAIYVWVRAAELLASEIKVDEFNENLLRSSLEEMRLQTSKKPEEAFPKIEALCAAAGVAFVLVPGLSHTGISGCARWLTEKKAMIALTLRYKWADQIWFTFFHEVAHLLLHKKEHGFILDNAADFLTDQVIDPQMRKNEEEANRFSGDTLIAPEKLYSFIKAGHFTNDAVHDFAEELGIGPGIVVGRLQHEKLIKHFEGNALRQQIIGILAND